MKPLAALLAAALAIQAASTESPRPMQTGHWEISTGIGTADIGRSDIRVRQSSTNTSLTYHSVRWDDEAGQFPPIYNFRAVYWPKEGDGFGYGFEFVHLKFIADPDQVVNVSGTLSGNPYNQTEPLGNTLQRWTITNGLNMFHAVGVARKHFSRSEGFPEGRASVYGGLGAGFAMPHPVTQFLGGPNRGGYEYGGFSWHILGGLQYRLTPKLGLCLECKHSVYDAKVDMAGGAKGEARLKSTSLWIGTTWRL